MARSRTADHGLDWLPKPVSPSEDFGYLAFYDSCDALLMGRKTYEACSVFSSWPYFGKTSYVFTSNLPSKPLKDVEFIPEKPDTFVSKIKQQPGKDFFLVGGGQLIDLLHDAGLIDVYIITWMPLVLGAGIPVFPDVKKQQNLQLVNCQAYSDIGMVQVEYRLPVK